MRTGMFVGRKELLEQMQDNLLSGDPGDRKEIVYLLGMGGVGKTQLALEYAQRNMTSYKDVFWVSMANEETASLGFRSIYQRLRASKQMTVAPTANDGYVTLMVKAWLRSQKHNHWLLILDNLDDLESWNYKEYMPGGPSGSIVVTSRRLDLDWFEKGNNLTCIRVQELRSDEALQLLVNDLRISGSLLEEEERAARSICRTLGYLPLALGQVSAYMNYTKASLPKYETFLANHAKKAMKFSPPQALWPYNRTVVTTWELSIPQLTDNARRLLGLFAFLHHQQISFQLLRQHLGDFHTAEFSLDRGRSMPRVGWLLDLTADEDEFDQTMARLDALSLIQLSENAEISLHPLVHFWAAARLDLDQQITRKREALTLLLCKTSCSYDSFGEWNVWSGLAVQFRALIETKDFGSMDEVSIDFSPDQRSVLAWVYGQLGYYAQCITQYNLVFSDFESDLESNREAITSTVKRIGQVSFSSESRSAALDYLGRASRMIGKLFGNSHILTLSMRSNEGLLLEDNGHYGAAQECYKSIIEICEPALGADHPLTLDVNRGLATVLKHQGKREEALKLYECTIEAQKRTFGEAHPLTLETMNRVADLLRSWNRGPEAFTWYTNALRSSETALGHQHPRSIKIRSGLAKTHRMLGELDQALEASHRVLDDRRKLYYHEHVDVIEIENDIGTILFMQDRYDDALKQYEEALSKRMKILGPAHPSTMDTIESIGRVYEAKRDFGLAHERFTRALKGRAAHKDGNPAHVTRLTSAVERVANTMIACGTTTHPD